MQAPFHDEPLRTAGHGDHQPRRIPPYDDLAAEDIRSEPLVSRPTPSVM